MTLPPSFVELCEAQQDTKISNVIGTVIDMLPPKMTRKGDYMLTFTLDDGTLQCGQKCRLFAKKVNELPQIKDLGDVVILRRVRYSIIQGTGLLCTPTGYMSEWTVFHSPIPKDLGIFGANPKAVRFRMPTTSTEEMKYIISLSQTQDRNKFTPLTEEVRAKVTAPKTQSKCLIKDLMIDTYPRIVGEVVKIYYNFERATLYITDYTENHMLYNYGATTQDQANGLPSRWSGPPGKYTLIVECWPPHSQYIRDNVTTGNFVQLDNIHIKRNPDHGRTEGALHASKFHEDQLRIRKLEVHDVAELLYRKEQLGWADGFEKKIEESDDEETKNQTDKSSKKRSRHQRRKERDRAEREAKRAKSAPDSESESEEKKSVPQSYPAVQMINENVRCENGPWSHRTIPEIRKGSKPAKTAENDQETAARTTSYTTVRVVDFKPIKLEDFAKAREMTLEEQQATEEATSTASSAEDSDSSGAHSSTSLYHNSTQVRRQIWEWKFALLLEDASGSSGDSEKSDKDQIITFISNADAEYLLGMKALDLRRNNQTLNRLRETMFILWGDLEERKEQKEARVLAGISANASSAGSSGSSQGGAVASRPFKCILEEYGEEVNGEARRKFRIKGTTIVRTSSPVKQEAGKLDSWDEVGEDDVDYAVSMKRDLSNEVYDSKAVSVRAPRAG